jgi:hypothetical protein
MIRSSTFVKSLAICAALVAAADSSLAGPIYTFTTSTGLQPSNVGIITLTQVDGNTVDVLVDLIDTTDPAPQYGFINTGGPHTPFAFTLAGSETGVTASFLNPAGGTYSSGQFSLSLAGGDNTPFGTYGVAIASTAGNGSGNAFYGDLHFTINRPTGLSTDDFVSNGLPDNAYFSADLTNGQNTGAQAWVTRTTTTVPDTGTTLALFGLSMTTLAGLRSRFGKRAKA